MSSNKKPHPIFATIRSTLNEIKKEMRAHDFCCAVGADHIDPIVDRLMAVVKYHEAPSDPKWRKAVLDFDPFSGDDGDTGDRELRDTLSVCKRGGSCHGCTQRIWPGTVVRRIVKVYVADGLMSFRFCRGCCDAMALSWTDGGAALQVRNRMRGDD